MRVLVIFGSTSDKVIYDEIAQNLRENGAHYEVRVLSAHKTPKEVDEIKFDGYGAIVAGAGLAAHLPGVIAARTTTPVFGIPCSVAYDGIDSFLSIAQMPPGIPVIATGVGNGIHAASAISLMASGVQEIALCYRKRTKAVDKAIETLERFKAGYEMDIIPKPGRINVLFIEQDEEFSPQGITICCPVSDSTKAEDAFFWFRKAQKGLWVGQNRGENAAIAAMQVSGRFRDELAAHKEGMRVLAVEADRTSRYG